MEAFNKDRIILGIDPGTVVMGVGIIHILNNKPKLIYADVLKLSKVEDHALRLKTIFQFTLDLIDLYKPDELAAEAPFFGKNVQSMLKLGRAQGVALAAGLYRDLPISEYSPRKIKQSITGKGEASKDQVAEMIKRILNVSELNVPLDATDGLAAALCHYFNSNRQVDRESPKTTVLGKSTSKKSTSSWSTFVNSNPDRVIEKPKNNL